MKSSSALMRGRRDLFRSFTAFSLLRWDSLPLALPSSCRAADTTAEVSLSTSLAHSSTEVRGATASSNYVWIFASSLSPVLTELETSPLITWSSWGVLVAGTLGRGNCLLVANLVEFGTLRVNLSAKKRRVFSKTSTRHASLSVLDAHWRLAL